MQLSQAKPIRAFDCHHCRPGQIDTDFDHNRRDQHIGVTVDQVRHDRLFILGRQAAMQEPNPRRQFVERALAQELELRRRGFDFKLVRLLNQWADDEGLSAQPRLVSYALVDDFFAVRWRDDLRLHPKPTGRQFINHR